MNKDTYFLNISVDFTGLFEKLVMFLCLMIEILNSAFIDGSSKHGNAFLASVD
jgi:hypothetical protein